MTRCKKVVNIKTSRVLKSTLNGGSIGWWIGDKFVVKSKVSKLPTHAKKRWDGL